MIEITKRSLDICVQTNLPFWKICLDTCCLSRLFDPPTQRRVIGEAEATNQVLTYCFSGHWYWVSSRIVTDEVEQTPDVGKRIQIKNLLALAHEIVAIGRSEISRGLQLESLGFKEQDALHLACAESGRVDIFLTTDDRLLTRAQRYHERLHVRVENPETWLREVIENGHLKDDGS